MLVEGGGLLVFGVDDYGTESRDLGSAYSSHHGVTQETFAQTSSLLRLLDRKASNDEHRDRMLGHTLADFIWGLLALYLPIDE